MRFSALAFTALIGPSTAFSTKSSTPAAVCNNKLRMSTVAEPETVTNPLLESDDLPKFGSIEPSQLTPAMTTILETLESQFSGIEDKLKGQDAVGYDDVLPELEKMSHPLEFAWSIASHLNGVKNGDELRAAYEENQPKVVAASMKFSQSKPIYDALVKVQDSLQGEESKEDDFVLGQRKRAVEKNIRSMTLGGVGLEEGSPEQIRFKEIKMRMAELSTSFSNNVLDATKAFGLEVTDPEDVEGVPESAKAMWAQAHLQNLIKEEKDEEKKKELEATKVDASAGPWRITLDGPSYLATMQHLPNRELRKKIYLGYLTRASEMTADEDGKGNNVPLIDETLKLRKELSGILGFDNYAELSLESKMAPSVESVKDLSNLILEKALPAAEKELAAATALAREAGGEEYSEANLPKLMPWDVNFWNERLKEKTFELKEEELRPYFALDEVLKGKLSSCRTIASHWDMSHRNSSPT